MPTPQMHLVIVDINGREWVGDTAESTASEAQQVGAFFSEGVRTLPALAIPIAGHLHYFNTDNIVSVAVITGQGSAES